MGFQRPISRAWSTRRTKLFGRYRTQLAVDTVFRKFYKRKFRKDLRDMASAAQEPRSPLTSPRLPSPPPVPEVQIGKSASMDANNDGGAGAQQKTGQSDRNAMRRIRPGTKAADMSYGPPKIPLHEVRSKSSLAGISTLTRQQIDSSFQNQEYLKSLYQEARHHPDTKNEIPITRESALYIATPPEGVEKNIWLYELARLLLIRTNDVIVHLYKDNPPCSPKDCPEMRASEWQYLCAVHDPPKSCSAIDYSCHTLDWATNVLTSTKLFPSRLNIEPTSIKHMVNVFRRVYRIFAHAWFQHREIFWMIENTQGLYMLYKTVCETYHVMEKESYTIPPEAEGLEADANDHNAAAAQLGEGPTRQPPSLTAANRNSVIEIGSGSTASTQTSDSGIQTTLSTGATTRRHKQSPSVGSFVQSIAEGEEDNDDHEYGANKAEYLQTVRRDGPSSSPPKRHSPVPNIAVSAHVDEKEDEEVKDKSEEKKSEVKSEEDLSEMVKDLAIKDDEPDATDDDAASIASVDTVLHITEDSADDDKEIGEAKGEEGIVIDLEEEGASAGKDTTAA